MTDTNSAVLSDRTIVLGMIGAWAEQEEKFLSDKIEAADGGDITLTAQQASIFVEALHRIQEGLVIVLNEDGEDGAGIEVPYYGDEEINQIMAEDGLVWDDLIGEYVPADLKDQPADPVGVAAAMDRVAKKYALTH